MALGQALANATLLSSFFLDTNVVRLRPLLYARAVFLQPVRSVRLGSLGSRFVMKPLVVKRCLGRF